MIHLHLHSQFSVLDGLGSVENIVKRAKELGHRALAITDHASISCMPELIEYTNEHNINPILGCEFYVVDDVARVLKEKRYHLTVWAKDWTGVQSIMKQLTLANRQFYYRPRISFKQALDFENCFIGTACAFGVLAHPEYLEIYKSLFRKYGGNLFLEIMPHIVNLPENPDTDIQRVVNDRARELRRKIGGKFLLTNDAHYVKAEDAETHRVLLCTQYRKAITEFAGWGGEFFMKSQIEMIEAGGRAGLSFDMIKEGIESTNFIADNCSLEKPEIGIHLPSIYPDDTEAFLRIVLDGWQGKIDGVVDDIAPYHDRLMHEIKIIKGMQFEKYFLIVHDMIAWARGRGIMVGPARGCFLPGTKVKSAQKYKNIEDIQVGDKVYSSFGSLRTVNDVFKYDVDEEILDIEFADGTKISCTSDHLFLTTEGWIKAGELTGDHDICDIKKHSLKLSKMEQAGWDSVGEDR